MSFLVILSSNGVNCRVENNVGMNEEQLSLVEYSFGTAFSHELRTFLMVHAGSKTTVNGDVCCFDITYSDGWTRN